MNYYRITNRATHEKYLVDSDSAQEACASLGWQIGYCYVENLSQKLNNLRAREKTYRAEGLAMQAADIAVAIRQIEADIHNA